MHGRERYLRHRAPLSIVTILPVYSKKRTAATGTNIFLSQVIPVVGFVSASIAEVKNGECYVNTLDTLEYPLSPRTANTLITKSSMQMKKLVGTTHAKI